MNPPFFCFTLNKFPYDLTSIYPLIVNSDPVPFGDGDSDLDRIFREEGAALLLHQPQFENDLRKFMGDAAKKELKHSQPTLKSIRNHMMVLSIFIKDKLKSLTQWSKKTLN